MSHSQTYLSEAALIALTMQANALVIEKAVLAISEAQARIYIVGLGGSMANAIHMAADLRKLCHKDALACSNIAEFTARANDEGMEHVFTGWLRLLNANDLLIVLSVGGGTDAVSQGITQALGLAKERGTKIIGIVGPDGGATAKEADICIKVPAPRHRITPHAEAFQAVIWHLMVSHPKLQVTQTVW